MNDNKSNNQNPRDSLPGELFKTQNNEWVEVWEKSVAASPYIDVSDAQTEQALSSVHKKIDQLESPRQQFENTSPKKWVWAAAITMLAAGLGYMLFPKYIAAPRGEIVSHILPDGSKIELNSGSEITYNRLYGYLNRSVDLHGEAFFNIENGNHPFRVQTINATVAVTGTKFNVRSWKTEKETAIAVAEGSVIWYPNRIRGDTVHLVAGQMSSLDYIQKNPTLPVDANITYLTGWRNQILYIKDRPLWTIFNELERMFDLQIEIGERVKLSDPMTVHYVKPDDPESIIADICRVRGLQYSHTANGFIIKN